MRIDRIKLRLELAKRDMTQKKLSELSGVSRVTVNAIVNGKRCSSDVADKIALALNVDIKEILAGDEHA